MPQIIIILIFIFFIYTFYSKVKSIFEDANKLKNFTQNKDEVNELLTENTIKKKKSFDELDPKMTTKEKVEYIFGSDENRKIDKDKKIENLKKKRKAFKNAILLNDIVLPKF